jgi:quercetin dioxygenase-like cupin family protein
VRLVRFDPEQGRELDRFGSVGFVHVRLAASSGDAALSVVHLAAGGRIGRHPAASAQVLAVVSGSGLVSGGSGEEQPIDAGTAAVWEEGEEHETRTAGGLVAFMLEGAAVRVLAEP